MLLNDWCIEMGFRSKEGAIRFGTSFGWTIDYGSTPAGNERESAAGTSSLASFFARLIDDLDIVLGVTATRILENETEIQLQTGIAAMDGTIGGVRLRITTADRRVWEFTEDRVTLRLPTDGPTFDFELKKDRFGPIFSAEMSMRPDVDFGTLRLTLEAETRFRDFGFAPTISGSVRAGFGDVSVSVTGRIGRDDFGLVPVVLAPELDLQLRVKRDANVVEFNAHYDRGAVGGVLVNMYGVDAEATLRFDNGSLTLGGVYAVNTSQWMNSLGGSFGKYPYRTNLVAGNYWQATGEAEYRWNDVHSTRLGVAFASGPLDYDNIVDVLIGHTVRPSEDRQVTIGGQLWLRHAFDGAGVPINALGGSVRFSIPFN